jgi:hypothetical protein
VCGLGNTLEERSKDIPRILENTPMRSISSPRQVQHSRSPAPSIGRTEIGERCSKGDISCSGQVDCRITCFACGLPVCGECSLRIHWYRFGRVRVCHNCLEDHLRARVIAERPFAGAPEMTYGHLRVLHHLARLSGEPPIHFRRLPSPQTPIRPA